jgi:hypothetical protein
LMEYGFITNVSGMPHLITVAEILQYLLIQETVRVAEKADYHG